MLSSDSESTADGSCNVPALNHSDSATSKPVAEIVAMSPVRIIVVAAAMTAAIVRMSPADSSRFPIRTLIGASYGAGVARTRRSRINAAAARVITAAIATA